MASRFGNSAATLALGVTIFATPALWSTGSLYHLPGDQELLRFKLKQTHRRVVLQACI